MSLSSERTLGLHLTHSVSHSLAPACTPGLPLAHSPPPHLSLPPPLAPSPPRPHPLSRTLGLYVKLADPSKERGLEGAARVVADLESGHTQPGHRDQALPADLELLDRERRA